VTTHAAGNSTLAQGTQVVNLKATDSSSAGRSTSEGSKNSNSTRATSTTHSSSSSSISNSGIVDSLGTSNKSSEADAKSASAPGTTPSADAEKPFATGTGKNETAPNSKPGSSAAATSEQQLTGQNSATGSLNNTRATPIPSRTGTGGLSANFASITNSSSLPLTTGIPKFKNNSFSTNSYGGLDYLDLPPNLLVSLAPNLTSSFAPVITGVPDFDMSILDPGILAAIFQLNSSHALRWDNIPWDRLQETSNGTYYFGLPLSNNQSYQVMSAEIQYNSLGSNVTHPQTALPTGGPAPPNFNPPFSNGTATNGTGPPGGGSGGQSPPPPPPVSPLPSHRPPPPPGQPANTPTNRPGNPQGDFGCSGTYTSFETTPPHPGQKVVTDTYTIPVTGEAPTYCDVVVYAFRPLPTKTSTGANVGGEPSTVNNPGTIYHQQSIIPSYINSASVNFANNANPPKSTPAAQNGPAPKQNNNPGNKPAEGKPSPDSGKPSSGNPSSNGGKSSDNPSLLNLIPIINAGGSSSSRGNQGTPKPGTEGPTPNEETVGAIIANAFGLVPSKDNSQGNKKPSSSPASGGKDQPPSSPAQSGTPNSIGEIIANAFGGGKGQPTKDPHNNPGSNSGKGGSTPSTGTVNGVTYTVGPDSVTLNGQKFPIDKPQIVTMPDGQTVTIGPENVSIGNTVVPVPGQSQSNKGSGSGSSSGSGTGSSSPPSSGKVHGVTFTVQPNAVTLNGQTFSPGVPQTLTLPGGQIVAIGPDGVDIGGTFIPIPGPSDPNSNTGSSKSGGGTSNGSPPTGISNGYPSTLKPSGIINGIPYSISNGGVVIGGETLSPAKPTTLALPGGHSAEIGPGGLTVDNVFVPMDAGNTPYSGAPSVGVIDGVPYSFTSNGIIVDGQTYAISQPATVNLPGGATLDIQPGGQIKINNIPVALPGSGEAGTPPSGSVSGVEYTFKPGTIQLDGQTYSLSHPVTTTLSNGQTLVIGQDGSVQIGGVTIPNTNVPIGSEPQAGVVNGVSYSIQPGAIVVGGQSYSLASPTTTKLPSGQTLTIKPDGTVQINGKPVNSMNAKYYGNINGVSYALSPSGTITIGDKTISAAIPTLITLPNGHTVQVAPDGEIAIDNISISEPPSFVSAIAAAPTAATVGGLTFSVGKSLVIVDGTTFTETPGARPTTIVKNGKTITIGPSGVTVDHTTVPLRGTTVGVQAKATKASSAAKSTSKPSVTAAVPASPSDKKNAATRSGAVGGTEKFLLGFAAGFASLGFLLC
jgi:hypothetical protein